jgi:hypothetical protein
VDLLLKEVSLDGAEEVFGLRQGQPKMLDALLVLVEGDDIGDGLFLTLIVTDDELQFDTHSRASPGSSGKRRVHAILPDVGGFPQHLHALVMHRGWAYFQARLAFTMAAFNVLVQWHGLQPNASGFVPLSLAEFSLYKTNIDA